MSAFVGKADIGWTYGNVRFRVRADIAIQTRCVCFWPKADIAPVFSNFPNVVCVDEPSETHHACVQCGGSDARQLAFTVFVYGDHAAARSISVGSSPGARELFTRRDTGHACK
jgi:hypothetical protein